MEGALTFRTEVEGFYGPEPVTFAAEGYYIGRCNEGPVALYSRTGAELAREAFMHDARGARRAIRTVRRATLTGPMRIRCSVYTEQGDLRGEDSEPMYSAECDVYGWRAALTAIRAMRAEMPHGWRLHHDARDARLDDLFADLRGES